MPSRTSNCLVWSFAINRMRPEEIQKQPHLIIWNWRREQGGMFACKRKSYFMLMELVPINKSCSRMITRTWRQTKIMFINFLRWCWFVTTTHHSFITVLIKLRLAMDQIIMDIIGNCWCCEYGYSDFWFRRCLGQNKALPNSWISDPKSFQGLAVIWDPTGVFFLKAWLIAAIVFFLDWPR